MSLLTQIFGISFLLPVWGTSSLFSGPPIGTYKTVTVSKAEQCSQLCHQDSGVCAGTVALQPDITENIFKCYLNDGLAAGSPFEIMPPEPLDLNIALSDYNEYRARFGLQPVRLNAKLNAASQIHAEDMAHHGIVSHSGTDGSTHSDRVQRKGYYYSVAAENVASGQESWDKVFAAWQKSPGHNENLLIPDVTDFGIALVYERTTQYRYYWAMLVAAPYPS